MTDKIKKVFGVLTTNDYTVLIAVKVPSQIGKLLIYLKEEGENDVLFKIQGALDKSFAYPEDLKPETTLAKGGSTYETLTDSWLYVRVLHKAVSGEAQGKVTCFISGSG